MAYLQHTKAERREKRQANRRKMRVSGRGNRLLQKLIMEKSVNALSPS